ncbi:hypothetical protein CASFOL_038211 [Castilleja foliolosa]|uniref:Uncharacterized protein n=1 Tax=Castilleja foliolosa TaxID=1961234 RepID=A0ABD3BME5_9LAMI
MSSSEGFPAVDAVNELNLGAQKDFQEDPLPADVITSKELKLGGIIGDQFEEEERKERKEQEKKDALQNIKTTLIVSGIIVAVAGAIFAITKKLREK